MPVRAVLPVEEARCITSEKPLPALRCLRQRLPLCAATRYDPCRQVTAAERHVLRYGIPGASRKILDLDGAGRQWHPILLQPPQFAVAGHCGGMRVLPL